MLRRLLLFMFFILFWINIVSANEYVLFYWKWCPHCAKVEKYLENQALLEKIDLKEIYYDKANQEIFRKVIKELKLNEVEVWVPFFLIKDDNQELSYKIWDKSIISYIKEYPEKIKNARKYNFDKCKLVKEKKLKMSNFWSFLLIIIPAAISDSINPCAFAVILILLWAILSRYKSRKKVFLAWILFSGAIFISYFLMWIWVYQALASASNTIWLKMVIWIMWIIVWLANFKDYFWYWKIFTMEVPVSWRPKLKQLINSITNPIWAFFIWFVVSLFLLPCTSWPYITILWYLASESNGITWLWYLYLFIYNFIFVLPMFFITIMVWNGTYKVEHLVKQKEKYIRLIHLIVGVLMLWLWIYVILDSWIIFNK